MWERGREENRRANICMFPVRLTTIIWRIVRRSNCKGKCIELKGNWNPFHSSSLLLLLLLLMLAMLVLLPLMLIQYWLSFHLVWNVHIDDVWANGNLFHLNIRRNCCVRSPHSVSILCAFLSLSPRELRVVLQTRVNCTQHNSTE